MRSVACLIPPVLVVVCAIGCSRSGGPDGGETGRQIDVYMFSEYIDPAILSDFEKATGIRVRLSLYEATEDMMAKLQQAGGDRLYDVVVASDHAIPVLAKLGLLQPIDPAKIPNHDNLDERFRKPPYDPQERYSVPYQWGTVGLMYRKDRLSNIEPTWGLLFERQRQPGSFVLMDSMRDMLGIALKYRGHSMNTRNADELRAAGELLLQTKHSPHMLGFEGGVGGKNKVASNEAMLAVVYNGDAIKALDEEPGCGFVVPREGTVIWTDAMTIPSGAANVEGAHRFINYILDARVGARLSNFNRYATPNKAAMPFIDEDDRNNRAIYPPAELIAKMEYLQDPGDVTRMYDEVWTSVKAR